jgi:DnaJ-class molecular chaperone
MVTTERFRQGAGRRACSWCDGHGRLTMGWPENVSWDENAYPCSPCGGRGWVADARRAPRASRRRQRR